MKRTQIAAAAEDAARARMRELLLSALEDHGGKLALVAADPRIGCDRHNLYHYARQAGVDLGAAARAAKRRKRQNGGG